MTREQRIKEISSILLLKKVKGFGPFRFRRIYERFKSFDHFVNIIYKSTKSMIDISSIEKLLGKEVFPNLINLLKVERREKYEVIAWNLFKRAEELNGHLITFFDEYYPSNLYKTNQSIPIIYAVGNVSLFKEQKFCAIVGTRNPSDWTISEVQKLVKKLVDENYVIVSGLAKGIDAVAHETALNNHGKTIAVTGCGPDVCYPPENRDLYDRIKKEGLIISEYPFGTRPTELSLKRRNKIIVGLSDYVVITETSVKGGTMNSYLAAVEQKKPIKIFLPFSDVGGNFSGNLKIYCDQRIPIERIPTGDEPNLSRLRMMKALIFDLDGTLWDSKNAMFLTIKSLLKERRMKIDETKIHEMIETMKSPLTVLKSLGFHEVTAFWKSYRKNYENVNLFSPSTKDILLKIANSGRKIGVVTSLKKSIACELMDYFDLGFLVSVVISPSETRARKPSPIPIIKAINSLETPKNQTIYIGDSDVDIQAAKTAGCFSGLAAWNRSVSITEKPDYIFPRFDDLLLIVK